MENLEPCSIKPTPKAKGVISLEMKIIDTMF